LRGVASLPTSLGTHHNRFAGSAQREELRSPRRSPLALRWNTRMKWPLIILTTLLMSLMIAHVIAIT
jgi:hypothetical protein